MDRVGQLTATATAKTNKFEADIETKTDGKLLSIHDITSRDTFDLIHTIVFSN